jgi:hypothetical protein
MSLYPLAISLLMWGLLLPPARQPGPPAAAGAELPASERQVHGRWPRSAIYTMRADGSGIRKIVN